MLKPVPGVAVAHRWIRSFNAESIFAEIAGANGWRGITSPSGRGADPDQTRILIAELSALLRRRKISSLLDVPCGAFSWMGLVDLTGVEYVGLDIVKELVERNRMYESDRVTFRQANLLAEPLPAADLILCRDCFVHFCYGDIRRALENMYASRSRYLLTTTFPMRRNHDIWTGDWRPLNLEAEPFDFPRPLELIIEGCTESQGEFADKSLGLWRIDDLVLHANVGRRVAPS
jgi:SAM-dependent methyltransferase